MAQEFGSSLAKWLWLKMFHEMAVKMWARKADLTGMEDPLPKQLTNITGKPCWLCHILALQTSPEAWVSVIMTWQLASTSVSNPRESEMMTLISFGRSLKSHTPSFLKYLFITGQAYSIWEGTEQGISSHKGVTQWLSTSKSHKRPSWSLAATIHPLLPNDLYYLCYFQVAPHMQNAFSASRSP